ncbi:MAG: fatty acid desaturase [Chloracidobacterium sp. CP2_5A]|nr:MAG: fatty acid desaturase [Chloracidobacterium sp. CP2_5A]
MAKISSNALDSNAFEKRLLAAVKPFAKEFRYKSWQCVAVTFALLGALLAGAGALPWWPLRLLLSLAGGLVMVRAFILFHDFMHDALLYRSRLGKAIFYAFGLLALTPPRYWRHTHNLHHAQVGKPVADEGGALPLATADVGAFPLMTAEQWRAASSWQRFQYRVMRHPATILAAYVTIFAFSFCFVPLAKDPRRHWDAALSLLSHGGLIAVLWALTGMSVALFAFVLPFALAAALGGYLFYVQHTFEGMEVLPHEEWSFCQGSLRSSSYLKLGMVMQWLTGNIGYHHIHHLNARIPFYRLPEVMEAVPELQAEARVVTLRPRDILRCFQLNLWDGERRQLVSYKVACPADDGQEGALLSRLG